MKNGYINTRYIAKKMVEKHEALLREWGMQGTVEEMEDAICKAVHFSYKNILHALIWKKMEVVIRNSQKQILIIFKFNTAKRARNLQRYFEQLKCKNDRTPVSVSSQSGTVQGRSEASRPTDDQD